MSVTVIVPVTVQRGLTSWLGSVSCRGSCLGFTRAASLTVVVPAATGEFGRRSADPLCGKPTVVNESGFPVESLQEKFAGLRLAAVNSLLLSGRVTLPVRSHSK